MKPDEFWDMTLREVALYSEGAAYRMISLAWHTEAFARQKRLQPLDKILKEPMKEQTPEEQEKVLRAIFEPMVKQ